MDNAVFQNEIVPFYFGISPERLYGCHHLPQNSAARPCAVVLCYPIAQEYIRSHRAIYQLAVHLARAGFHVLRFDYLGCGDSEGDFEEGSCTQWISDIHCAIAEIQERSGLTSISLVGLRIGATLALQAATDCRYVESIILWEPIFNGRLHFKELAKMQENLSSRLLGRNNWKLRRPGIPDEILGFPFTSQLKQDLERINLDRLELSSNIKLLALCNSDESDRANGSHHFIRKYPHADFHVLADHLVWMEEVYKRLIPFNTVQYLVRWIGAVHP
jgi:uncharacterized protein